MELKKKFISFIFDILRRIATFSDRHSVFFVVVQSDVTSRIYSFDVTVNVACQLSQPVGKTEVSNTALNITNCVS